MVGSTTVRNFSFFCGNVLRLYDFRYENTEHEWPTILYCEFIDSPFMNWLQTTVETVATALLPFHVWFLIVRMWHEISKFYSKWLFVFIKAQPLETWVEPLGWCRCIQICRQPRIYSNVTDKLIYSISFIFLVQRIRRSIKVTQFRCLAPESHVGCRLHCASLIELYSDITYL